MIVLSRDKKINDIDTKRYIAPEYRVYMTGFFGVQSDARLTRKYIPPAINYQKVLLYKYVGI